MSINDNNKYLVSPKPPLVSDDLPHIGAGLRFAHSPTQFFNDLREQYGDTFLVDVFGYKLFCVFSPAGLKSLYAAAEEDASFGMATFDMLGFKTPIEVFLDAHLDLFYELLKPDRVTAYIQLFSDVIADVISQWDDEGEIDVFDAIRTLEQRIGFRVWIGKEASQDGLWQLLKQNFDVLSQENAFVNPQQTLETITSGKAKEKQAIAEITALISTLIQGRQEVDEWPDDNLSFLYRLFESDDQQVTVRKVAHNIINANQGFLSNLYAALAWTLINVQRHHDARERIAREIASTKAQFGPKFYNSQQALDSMRECEQLFLESIRLAQRSITLRKVMKELQFDCGDTIYTVQPGVYITTMLSVTNTQSSALKTFDLDHYKGRKIHPELIADGKESVSTFGHGKHACPAQKFSHNMCKVFLSLLMENFEFTPIAEEIAPSSSQMGGVSRAAVDVRLRYKRKRRGHNDARH